MIARIRKVLDSESGLTAVGVVLALCIVALAVVLGVASHPLFFLLVVLAIVVALVL